MLCGRSIMQIPDCLLPVICRAWICILNLGCKSCMKAQSSIVGSIYGIVS